MGSRKELEIKKIKSYLKELRARAKRIAGEEHNENNPVINC